jgi:Domain of unknown function (DUF1707)
MTDEISQKRPDVRASHEDRDRVVEQLRVAAGDGRLTLEELDERLERALSARTEGELASLVTDLPAPAAGTRAAPAAKDLVRIQVAASSTRRDGPWALPRALDVSVDAGTVVLDLTNAVISEPTLRITVAVRMGTLNIVTRPGIVVDADEVSVIAGEVKVRTPPAAETFLRVEVSGSVQMGSIVARPPRRRFLDWLLRRQPKYGAT